MWRMPPHTTTPIERDRRMLFARIFVVCALLAALGTVAQAAPEVSHGPMLGAVSEGSARIWLRTTEPAKVSITVAEAGSTTEHTTKNVHTKEDADNTCIVLFDKLERETDYSYIVRVGETAHEGTFTTLGASLVKKSVRLVYGYGYSPRQDEMPAGTSIYTKMAERERDVVMFLGDFPYTSLGRRGEIWKGNKELRAIVGFRELTCSTPTYGIYDDHDFGPNDCDGTHEYADEALLAFKEYWPNPSYGLPENKGIYCSFVVGDVEFFLLDGRYQARLSEKTMLGKIQYNWLCQGLNTSKCRYKVLVSGTQFGRVKGDSWAGKYYIGERTRLFTFIYENKIGGVVGISGDVHRSDIYKLPIGKDRFFYDFTPGALSRKQRTPPDPMPAELIRSYGRKDDNNMFGELEFRPATDKDSAIIFRSFSGKNGLVYEHVVSPDDLGLE